MILLFPSEILGKLTVSITSFSRNSFKRSVLQFCVHAAPSITASGRFWLDNTTSNNNYNICYSLILMSSPEADYIRTKLLNKTASCLVIVMPSKLTIFPYTVLEKIQIHYSPMLH